MVFKLSMPWIMQDKNDFFLLKILLVDMSKEAVSLAFVQCTH